VAIDVRLSFCITVYNQTELVKKCIESILPYKKNDIEIVISDDNSTEDIEKVVLEYNDERIKYFKTRQNLGHDRNILNAIACAEGEYVFILRSRDRIVASSLPSIINKLSESKCSYMATSSVNEKGIKNLVFRDAVYKVGKEASDAHFKLFVHPSGNIYSKNLVRIADLSKFLESEQISKHGFIVHDLIRMQLAEEGDFLTSSIIGWEYFTSENSKDIAVNSSATKESVYSSKYILQRFRWESRWNLDYLNKENRERILIQLIEFYLFQITWNAKLANGNVRMQRHYNYEKVKYSVLKEQRNFKKTCSNIIIAEYKMDMPMLILEKIFFKNIVMGSIKYFVMKALSGTKLYVIISNFYKKWIKGV